MRRMLALAAAVLTGCTVGDDGFDGFSGDGGVFVPPAAVPDGCDRVDGVPPDEVFDPDVVRLAVILPESGFAGWVGASMQRAISVAADDLAAIGGPGGGRRIATVACDTRSEPSRAVELTRAVLTTLRPAAIIGPGLSASARALADAGLFDGDMLFVSPSATVPGLTALDEQLWRTAPDDARLGVAIGRRLDALEVDRVTLYAGLDPRSRAIADAVARGWCDGPCPVGALRRVDLEPAAPGEITPPDADAVVVVLPAEAALTVLTALADHAGPVFVDDSLHDPGRLTVLPPALLERITGVTHAQNGDFIARLFADRYRAAWGADPEPYAAQAYDAFWLLAHAIGDAARSGRLDTAAYVDRLRRFSAGATVFSGVDEFRRGQFLLRDGAQTIDFVGASGPLDFGPDRQAAAAVAAWRVEPETGAIVDLGVVLEASED